MRISSVRSEIGNRDIPIGHVNSRDICLPVIWATFRVSRCQQTHLKLRVLHRRLEHIKKQEPLPTELEGLWEEASRVLLAARPRLSLLRPSASPLPGFRRHSLKV